MELSLLRGVGSSSGSREEVDVRKMWKWERSGGVEFAERRSGK